MDSDPKCWICLGDANSGEHGIKKSDLKAVFGTPSQTEPLRVHSERRRNVPVGSLDNSRLKLSAKICAHCNNARTQAADRAWETLSKHLLSHRPAIASGTQVDLKKVFPAATDAELINMHLYFVKHFGCRIAAETTPIPIQGFSQALLTNTPHPDVYLRFGVFEPRDFALAAISDLIGTGSTSDPQGVFGTYFYELHGLGVQAIFAANFGAWPRIADAWHPRFGQSILHFKTFDQPE